MSRVVIVTGGGRGIGAATCRILGGQGYSVAVNYRADEEAAAAVVRDVEAAGGKAVAIQADTAEPADVARLFETSEQALGPLYGLVNNAGMHGPRGRFDEAVAHGDMVRVLGVNVIGPMLCIQAAIPRLSTRHGGKGGAIVNVSSGAATRGSPNGGVLYATSKGALNSLSTGLSQELAGEGIRLNSVAPGLTRTDMPTEESLKSQGPGIPIGRVGEASEIAEAIVWLLSDAASYVAGANIRVAGGRP